MGKLEFIDWLQKEIKHRGWVQTELARRAKISVAQMSRIMTGEQGASAAVCRKIAYVLGLPPEEVMRRAGILPRSTTPDDVKELLFYYTNLNKHDRGSALAMLRALYEQYGGKQSDGE
ncbi:MAG TPA: helix-turn-helix transcriptional regulator [Armatimonadota bacterium]|nr:helix-turn-helix transcriptional regulator [Armatimonadota bacterium]